MIGRKLQMKWTSCTSSGEMSTKDVIEYLKRVDESFYIEGNLYHAPKAFKVNSIIKFCAAMQEEDNISFEETETILELVRRYLQDEADVFWEGHKIMFKLKEDLEEETDDD